MDEKKALSTLSLLQSVYTKDAYQALQLALDDIALVMNILAIYNDKERYGDYLPVLDDVIKAFIEQRSAK